MSAGEFSDRSIYRRVVEPGGLVPFSVSVAESDLQVLAESDLSAPAREALGAARAEIEAYISRNPGFREALEPWPGDPKAPPLVRRMIAAGRSAGVGPMAAVAGAVAGAVGRALLAASREVVVENGGDIFAAGRKGRVAAVFAGESSLSMKLGVRLPAAPRGLGLCTSSGTVGPSLSRGRADAAVVLSRDECLADAAATELGNRVKARADLAPALEWAQAVNGLDGVLVIIGEDLAAWGSVELVRL
jgi:ApbE superfamily uncharacterized protein (UPF0280 family)